MKKAILILLVGLLWCNVGFAQSDLLLNLLYFSTTNEKKIQRLPITIFVKMKNIQIICQHQILMKLS